MISGSRSEQIIFDVSAATIGDQSAPYISHSLFEGLNDIYANVDFDGLVCRIFNQNTGMLEGEQLWAEALDWKVSLTRFKTCLSGEGLVFYANPADHKTKKQGSSDGMTVEEKRGIEQDSTINAISFVPEYRLVLEAE